jgi:hypothetical protein
MKLTLLDMTQNILSRLDSDEVNSINDSTEALQVANVIRNTYFNIITRANLPEHKKLFQLDSSSDDLQPVVMSRPDNVSRIEWIKYDKKTVTDTNDIYEYVTILPLQQFLDRVDDYNTDDANVDSLVLNDITYNYTNDTAPSYCTIVDDKYLVFDSYDAAVDTTLQTSKTKCYGYTIPTFSLSDNFIPDMDDQQFPLLLNEATATAFVDLKQMPNEKAELESRRQWRTLQRTKSLTKVPSDFDSLPNFARRTHG